MKYSFEVKGVTPLMVHSDSVEGAGLLKEWRSDPGNKGKSVAGDDRSPSWSWVTYLHHDGQQLVIPSMMLKACLRNAGAKVPYDKSPAFKTFKPICGQGIVFDKIEFPLLVKGKPVLLETLVPLFEIDADMEAHFNAAKALGFSLDVRRVKVGQSKHVRVRPVFSDWSIKGAFEVVMESELKLADMKKIVAIAGNSFGIGDWRPQTFGEYGRFSMTLKAEK